jgi:primosomal protein N' (replication factor Y)
MWLFEIPEDLRPVPVATRIAKVAFLRGPEGLFDYLIPETLVGQVVPGVPVRVPFGRANRVHIGYCVAISEEPTPKRPAKQILDLAPFAVTIPEGLLRLGQWMVEYYVAQWSDVLPVLLPTAVREAKKTPGKPIAVLSTTGRELVARGEKPADISKKQWALLKHLAEAGAIPVSELTRACGCSTAPVSVLRRKGLLFIRREVAAITPEIHGTVDIHPEPQLTPEQSAAWKIIGEILAANRHEVVLVQGVTGSGKTELYMKAIAEVIGTGRQAIFLIPEVSLTPQFAERFIARFGRVAILHSYLSAGQRRRYWEEVRNGNISVVLGARSAVFAPTPRLGLIVIDEEQEWSFKQESSPRYHAREVALARGRIENVPVILGSATPSLETYGAAVESLIRWVELKERVFSRPLPRVEVVDLRDPAIHRGCRSLISAPLQKAIAEALDEGDQILLLLNRRGYASAVLCPVCGFVLRCPGCDVALTYHKTESAALCHYCNYQVSVPEHCPNCRAPGFHFLGGGTQRLEAEVRRRFPASPLARVDADAIRRQAYPKTLAAFRQGQIHILVGTQLIAKGLDFPRVGLVGVVNADLALHLPNFRAAERTFQLLTQVAGRAGRGERPGRVIIQTFCPDHPAIVAAANHDYGRFAQYELSIRQRFGYPPFSHALRLEIRSTSRELARVSAQTVAELIRDKFPQQDRDYRLLGPAPCFLGRLARRYRFHLLLTTKDPQLRQEIVKMLHETVELPKTVSWSHDVDPVETF